MKRNLLLLAVLAFFAVGCSDKKDEVIEQVEPENPVPTITVPADTIKVNKFAVDCMRTYYLWESETDWDAINKTYTSYSDPYKLFKQFVHKYDYWSSLTNNIGKTKDVFGGIATTYGYSLYLWRMSKTTNEVLPVVKYVYKGSPAEKAGIKRGDVFLLIDGEEITTDNYMKLFNSSSISLNLGSVEIENDKYKYVSDSNMVTMTAVEMYENPILCDTVIVKGDKKIGYFCFDAYQIVSEKDMINSFANFKSNNVTDVVLDLRYNSGGSSQTSQMLASILAPAASVKAKDVYLKQEWNALLTKLNKEAGDDMTERFVDSLSVNMDLNHIYILTSDKTASASEATIISLKPYIDVVQIGDSTAGKYCGGYLLSIDDFYNIYDRKNYSKTKYSSVSNWGMYVMVYRFANKDGYTSFVNGIAPNYKLEEDGIQLFPFGDEKDPLFGKSLELITGVPNVRSAVKVQNNYTEIAAPQKPWEGKLVDKIKE